jgi:hypothetical protein
MLISLHIYLGSPGGFSLQVFHVYFRISGYGSVTGLYECGNEPLGSVKGKKYLD